MQILYDDILMLVMSIREINEIHMSLVLVLVSILTFKFSCLNHLFKLN